MVRSKLQRVGIAVASSVALVACSAGPSSSGSSSGSPEGEEVAETQGRLTTAGDAGAPAAGACRVDDDGTLTRSADTCAGTGTRRVLVTMRAPATCASLFGTPMGIADANGVHKDYLFAGAPAAVRERYCVLRLDASAASTPDDWAEKLVATQCGASDVEAITRDCSGTLAAAPSPAHASARAIGALRAPSATAPTEASDMPNGCDVCATAVSKRVYFVLPPDFVAQHPGDAIVVRVGTPTPRDWSVLPPVGQQAFAIDENDVPPGVAMTVYPAGTVSSGKSGGIAQ